MTAKKNSSSFTNPVCIILILFTIIFVISGTYLYLQRQKTGKTTMNTNQPKTQLKATPTPRAIPHGKIGFGVGGSMPNAPTFGRGFLNPYDPGKNTTQIISIEISDKTGVTGVTGEMETDHGKKAVTFSLVEGTAQQGRWEAAWTVADSYFYTYNLKITAKNATTSDNVDITLR